MDKAESVLETTIQDQQVGRQYPSTPKNQEQRNQDIIDHFDKGYYEAQQSQNQSPVNLGGTGMASDMPPPLSKAKYSTEIALLKEITVKELELKRNEGHYFLGAVVKKAWKMPGPSCPINVLLKDKDGDLARGSFYGVTKSENWDDLEKIFPAGREVIVVQPCYAIALDGQYSILVENQSEFCFADEVMKIEEDFGKLIEKSKAPKDQGNRELKTKPKSALNKYIKSIQVLLKEVPKFTEEEEEFTLEWRSTLKEHEKKKALEHLAVVFSNCSLLEIEERKPLSALYYAKFSLWCNLAFFKAHLRIARALVDLLHLHEAQSLLETVKDFPEAAQFQADIAGMLDETLSKIKEYSSPRTVIDFLSKELFWNDEIAYIGPIEIFEDPNKGRGYRAMRDICRGETLLIESGFVFEKDNPDITYEVFNKLDKRQDLKAMYMNLFPTKKYSLTKCQTKEVPLNESLKETRHWENFTEVEVKELLSKMMFNTFEVSGKEGLFPHCSLFNHSCDPNTLVRRKKNMALVLAIRDIKKGEEICVTYLHLSNPRFKRRTGLLEVYGFECNCERCCEVGEWKQKEAETTGLICPECKTEVKCNENGKFVCPNGCLTVDYTDEEVLSTKVIKAALVFSKCEDQEMQKKLLDYLKQFEKYFPRRSMSHSFIRSVSANYHAFRKEEAEFRKYFDQVVELAKLNANTELPAVIANHLVEIRVYFGRNPTWQEFEALTYFGFKMEVIVGLWQKALNKKYFMQYFQDEVFCSFE